MTYTATYSPEDNKLRLYASSRLDKETYARVKANGFKWAPKQDLFVAPMWTPSRESFLIELAGEIGDEDKSLMERQEERSERFEEYSENRAADAEAAHDRVKSISDNIPMGQPILIGHHSEKHARKDAERIENGMRRTVKMWEQSKYWAERATAAIGHARYKELSSVRARRIKGLEADLRKQIKYVADATLGIARWERVSPDATLEEVTTLAGGAHGHFQMYMDLVYGKDQGDGIKVKPTVQEAIERALRNYRGTIEHSKRWITHIENRLTYERAMLAESGGTVADRTKPEKGGAVKCIWATSGGWAYIVKVNKVTVSIKHKYRSDGRVFLQKVEFDKLRGVMTAAEVQEKRDTGMLVHIDETGFILRDALLPERKEPQPENSDKFQVLKDQLKQGVQVVFAPQLFPTPPEIAKRMVELAQIHTGDSVLEPSAGTGRILDAILNRENPDGPLTKLVAVEVNPQLADSLATNYRFAKVKNTDFLQCNGDLGHFDRIIMNPPFEKGADIKHIKHAVKMLEDCGGRIVALCANGPRQQEQLKPLADSWEVLPADSFKESGTGVNVALLTITRH